MYRVLIVDDEEPVLDGYEYLLDSRSEEFSLVGKARSGFEALASILESKPDLVFMDINIPGMDGIEVIANIHAKVPDTVFILSTAYERFDLAQRAIPLGVFDYLVKPVSKRTFLATLDAAKAVLAKKHPGDGARDLESQERRFLNEGIWKELSEEEWRRYRELFSFRSDKALVCMVEFDQARPGPYREVASKLSLHHRCLFGMHLGRGLYLVPEDVDRETIASRLREAIGMTAGEDPAATFAVAPPRIGTELHLSCREVLEELQQRRSRAEAALRERHRVFQLRRKIGISPLEELRSQFVSLWEDIFASYEITVAKAKMVAVFTLLLDDYARSDPRYRSVGEVEPPFPAVEEIMAVSDLDEWAAWSDRAFQRLYELFFLRRSGNFPLPLARALEYLDERFADQVQLSGVAEAAQVSSAYLSRLFTEHLHTNFVDYLTELRVERAERLFSEARMNVKEVSFAVGYQDPNYFSKIFRKATGLSPSAYAVEHRSGKDI